jgi:predicted ester cyclase
MAFSRSWTLVIAATFPFLPGSIWAQADADKAERRSTVEASATAQKNAEIIRRQIDAVNSGDAIAAAQFFADDTINHGIPVGRAGAQRVLSDVFATFPDWHVEIVDLVAVGDEVVIREIVSGTHKGIGRMAVNGGLLMNVPPTGRRFKIQHTHWFTLRDGLIVAARANRDDVGMMQQLGLLPMPPAGGGICPQIQTIPCSGECPRAPSLHRE